MTTQTETLAARVREAIATVPDPEIPAVTIGDLGLIERVIETPEGVQIDLLPTFVGCPALDVIKTDVLAAARRVAAGRTVDVRFVYDPPWTTDRMNEKAHASLEGFGISPPTLLHIRVRCPYCGSLDTTIESEFGPTLCRTIRYCNACRNPFEGFKSKQA